MPYVSLSQDDRLRYSTINQENIDFLMNRNNRTSRWVVADMIRRTRYHFPEKTALVFGDISLTYTELEDQCNQVANALADLGVKKYDRVAILAHNTHHHFLTWMGCAKLGAIYLAVNYLLKDEDIAFCINHSESTVFIVEDSLYSQVEAVLDRIPSVRHLIWSAQGAGMAPPADFIDFDQWYSAAPATEPDVILRIEDPAQMTYTSGTESLPKGVIISNQALIAQYLGCIIDGRYDPADININALPIYHCAQRDVFMNPIFWIGGTNILMSPDVGQILAAIEQWKATMFFAPPTVWIGILNHPDFARYDLSSLVKCYYGASIMPKEVLREILEKFPKAGVYNYYGQTELAPYHTILKAEDALEKLGAAGKGGLHMESRIEDDTNNEITEPDIPGEICGRGPHVMTMYFKEPEKTEAAMKGGWFHSGDLGILDLDRYITVVDRKKDMIKTGGENVSSREVEEALYLHPAVEEVAVVGINHPRWVEAVTAVVKIKSGAELSDDELMNHCRKTLSSFKVPKKIVFVDALPKTPTGKILKRAMRETYKEIFT
ncbi:acyl-CoA synthetase [Desulforhopalus singaporensis]|uniref:Fatty-acyl-CoA synthase n=1 Tax=Desulforhopalus singaporensis TaxID=91360 RepID=A0A1H0Q612_9BACT|nr:acyl-CoA synthetase [Desulforhopalus singaporensis]SDP12590.1 fatty-acyl-CoA synthase [Desulforhopalus singaporensis]